MATSLIDAETVLAIDVGAVTTRAILFDVVEGRYRFLAVGEAPTTLDAPYRNIGEGVQLAIEQLEQISGYVIIDDSSTLVCPPRSDGVGVDQCVTLFSASHPLKTVLVGLLDEISITSGRNLLNTTYASVMDTIHLNDRRSASQRLDAILQLRPELILIVGGTEGGASQSMMDMIETVGLACYLLPKDQRPEILFAGNQQLTEAVQTAIGKLTSLHTAPNVRPSLEVEQIEPAQTRLVSVYRQSRLRQVPGASDLDSWSAGALTPTATAFGRTIRFISKEYAHSRKGVLGVDVGGTATTVAAGFGGELSLTVMPNHGLGEGLAGLLELSSMEDILRWLPFQSNADSVREYIYTKISYPHSIPATPEDLAMEHALTTQILQVAIKRAIRSFPVSARRMQPDLLPWFEPIIATGRVFGHAPLPGQIITMLLNGLQPVGVTTIALDQNNLAASLGAAAGVSPLLTIQALDATNFLNLGTVITPVGQATPGTPVLRVKVSYANGSENIIDVKNGSLEVIPVPAAQAARLQVQPLHRFDVGMGGPGVGGKVDVVGGALGVIIDARGRPLAMPQDPARRAEQMKKWLWTLGC